MQSDAIVVNANNNFLSSFSLARTRHSQKLRHTRLVMSVLKHCWQWMIHQPCPSSDSRGLTALVWTLEPCSRYSMLQLVFSVVL